MFFRIKSLVIWLKEETQLLLDVGARQNVKLVQQLLGVTPMHLLLGVGVFFYGAHPIVGQLIVSHMGLRLTLLLREQNMVMVGHLQN